MDIKGYIRDSSYRTCIEQTNGGKTGSYSEEGRVGGIRFERLSLLNFLERNEMFLK